MRAIRFHAHGGPEQLRYEEVSDPVCGPDDVVIRIRAAALNGFEPMILGKTTALRTPLPMIPGGDGCGEIEAVGVRVEGWRVGERVGFHPLVPGEGMTGETRLGTCCERVRVPADRLIRLPEGLGFEQAAALPVAYGTALRMVTTRGAIRAGERVLILGATGGVGTACVQLAKRAGAEVVACGSAPWKLERLKELGADKVIDTSREDFREVIWRDYGKPRMQGGGGVEVVINYIGGDTWVESLKCLAPGGRMLVCGATAGYATPNDARYVWTYELSIVGSNGWTMEDQGRVYAMAAAGELVPVIDSIRPLAETAEAVRALVERRFFGKLVLVP